MFENAKIWKDLADGKLPEIRVALSGDTFVGLGMSIGIPVVLALLIYFVGKSLTK